MSFLRWFQPTDRIAVAHRRAFTFFAVGLPAAFLIHFVVALLFWTLGARTLALLNIISLSIYAASTAMNRRGIIFAAGLLASLELVVHQCLCVHYVGWGAGFQYYLLVVILVIFFLPAGRNLLKVLLVSVVPTAYLLLEGYGASHMPVVDVDSGTLAILSAVNFSVVCALLAFFAWIYSDTADRAEASLTAARKRAEDLLHSILPVPIAARLEHGEKPIADAFESATILFADLVGFTPLSQSMTPADLVQLLDEVFSRFDALVEERGLEKIKTIGDAYMVAGGIPALRADHVAEMAGLALEMQASVRERASRGEATLHMRIGLHTGPVVAGVIGRRKFAYDLWGDAVNTAARMESHGLPDSIQVTRAVYEALQTRCRFEPRGSIEVKGKGLMETWTLLGWKEDPGGETPRLG